MKISTCSYRPILVPCRLKNIDYQIEEIVLIKGHQFWTQIRQKLENIQKDRQLDLSIHV